MPKDFKTIDELIDLLESRGVQTDEDTPKILQRESYYAIINGYKDAFLDRDLMQSSGDDVYKPGTRFDDIYSLFLYDRMLRHDVMPFIMSAEAIVKNAVVYAFCECNRGMLDYLKRENYVEPQDMLLPEGSKRNKTLDCNRNMGRLIAMLSKKNQLSGSSTPYERHYIETYGGVPLWVLQNDLTFGNISHFYQLQKRGVQNSACRLIAEVNGNGVKIGARDLLNAIGILVGYRNICAHDERLYCARVRGHGFDHMLNAIRLVLPYDESEFMAGRLFALSETFAGRVNPESLNAMYTRHGSLREQRDSS